MKRYILVEIPDDYTKNDVYDAIAAELRHDASVRTADVTECVYDTDMPDGEPWLATNGYGEAEPFYPEWD